MTRSNSPKGQYDDSRPEDTTSQVSKSSILLSAILKQFEELLQKKAKFERNFRKQREKLHTIRP